MTIPDKIDRYEIKLELGRGGMAIVYLAYDSRVKRDVALKVLPPQFLNDELYRIRFEQEALTIAKVEHPNIVPIYDFGEHDGQMFIVMRLMSSGSLADKLLKGPLDLPETAAIISRIAEAIDESHKQNVIHRDIKPHNFLFDAWGKAFLSDFGIAKIIEASDVITNTSVVIGTPEYMSPEHLRSVKKLDGRSDIYSLGVVIFQTLTGELPYLSETPIGIAMAHLNDPVPSIVEVRPDLPPECDELIIRAMAKNPDDRYETANKLATDLTAIAEKQKADQLSSPSDFGKPTRHLFPGVDFPAEDEKGAKNRISVVIEKSKPSSLSRITTSKIVELDCLNLDPIREIVFNKETNMLAVASGCKVLCADMNPKKSFYQLGSHNDWVWSVAWAVDGSKLASGGRDKQIKLWDCDTKQLIHVLTDYKSWVWNLAWSPDGDSLASANDNGTVQIWDTIDGQRLHVLTGHTAPVSSVTWSPDGTLLASGSDDGTVRIWDIADGKELSRLSGHIDRVRAVAWSPDGARLASTGSDGTVRIWDIITKEEAHLLKGHTGWVERVSWSPDGEFLLSGGSYRDNTVRIWNSATGKQIHLLESHTNPVFGVAWLLSAGLLASGDTGGLIRIWDLVPE